MDETIFVIISSTLYGQYNIESKQEVTVCVRAFLISHWAI